MKKLLISIFLVLGILAIHSLTLAEDCILQPFDPIPTKVIVSPAIANVIYGGDVDFYAHAYDQHGKIIRGLKPTSWEASAGIIYDDGWYIANIVGYHTVTAVYKCKVLRSGVEEPIDIEAKGYASVHVADPWRPPHRP